MNMEMTIADIHISKYKVFVLTEQHICIQMTNREIPSQTNRKY